jgi:protein-disulfide isomerase
MPNARAAKSTREKAAQLRLEEERRQARRRNITVAISTVVVLIIVIGAVVLFRTLKNQQDAKAAAAAAPPANLYTTSDGVRGVLYGKASAKVTVVQYEDFLCPACKAYEEADSALMRQYADQGKIKLVYVPVAILDNTSTNHYSVRAGSAAAAVLNVSPDKFIAYHDTLYANQPSESSSGLPDSTLVELATKAGVDATKVQAAINANTYSGWMTANTNDFESKYQPSTPTVLVGKTQLTDFDPTVVKTALDKAVAAAG